MKSYKYAQSTMNRKFREIRKRKECLIYNSRTRQSYLIENMFTHENEIIDLTLDKLGNIVVALISTENGEMKAEYNLK